MSTTRIYPISDNTDGDWLNESDNNTNLFASVDESVLNEADYIDINNLTVANTCLFNWTDFSGGSGTISEIIIYAQAIYSPYNAESNPTVQFAIPDAGHLGSTFTLTTSSALYHQHYPLNPHTGVAWVWADSFTAGIRSGGNAKVTVPVIYWLYADIVWEAAGGHFLVTM